VAASRDNRQDPTNEKDWASAQGEDLPSETVTSVALGAVHNSFDPVRASVDAFQMQALVLDSMTEGVSVSNEDGYILYTNPAEDRMFGYEAGELVQRHVTELNAYSPEDNRRIVAQVLDDLKTKRAWTGEWRNRKKDGTEFFTFARITGIELGGKQYWVCVQEDITERKRRDDHLRLHDQLARKQLAELEQIYRTAPVGLLFVGPDLRYVRLNERMAEINGLPVSAHIGRRIREVLPELAAQVEPLYRRAMATGQPILNWEMSGSTPANPGVTRTFLVSYYPVLDGDTTLGVTAVVEDVTSKKQAEAALQASEAQLRLVIDSIPGLVAYIDRNYRYRFVNQRYSEWFGTSFTTVEGKTVADAFGPDHFDLIRAHMDRALRGEPVVWELSHTYPDGIRRDVRVTYMPESSVDGSVAGFVSIVEDLTEQKKSEDAIRDSEERYRRIVETAAEGIWTVDRSGITTFVNARIAQLLGYEVDELLGKSAFDFVFKEDRKTALKYFHASQSGSLDPYDFRLRRKDGKPLWVNISASPLRDESGNFLGVLAMFTDVSERKRAEDAQRTVERQLTLLIEASGKLLASPQSSEVLNAILDLAQDFIDADAYSVWRKGGGDIWEMVATRGLSPNYSGTASESRARAQQLPTETMVIEDVEAAPLLANRREAHKAEGIRSMIMVPLRIQGSTAGTIVFYYRARHKFTDLDARVASALGNLASAALETAGSYTREMQMREMAQSAEQRANFLAEVGRVLSSSLDYEATLASVAELSVPSFSDWTAVDILTPAGDVRRVAVKHADPAKVALAYEYAQRFPPSETDSTRVALRTGKSVLVEQIPDSLLAEQISDPERLRFIRDLGLQSVIIVPLVANEQSFGVLSFITAESGRRYTVSDLWLAEEIARRAANAVHNAQLFTESKIAQEALRRSNTELQRANEDLNQFAYSASHDLQEPLRMVAVFSQLLARKYKGKLDAEADEFIGHTVEGAKRMEALLSDLLAYTRAVNIAGENITPVNLNTILPKVIANLKAAIDESGARVTYSQETPTLLVQDIHLVQLFQNLIGNAIKYRGNTKPTVNITFERQGTRCKICVSDNGIGIPAAYREQVFGLFRRLHGVEKYPGTGVGLAICQKITERYGGEIWVESEEGMGSTFCFTLPMADTRD
jgi:PAS domain S-box-containing protein